MTDDLNAIPGDLSPYGHKTMARCIGAPTWQATDANDLPADLRQHLPIGRYLDDARRFAADLKARGIIGDDEPGTVAFFDHVREEMAAEGTGSTPRTG